MRILQLVSLRCIQKYIPAPWGPNQNIVVGFLNLHVTRTRTNTNPNGTEANAAGRSVRACDARKSNRKKEVRREKEV